MKVADITLNLNAQALALLHLLGGEEIGSHAAPLEDSGSALNFITETAALYNGRERGIVLAVRKDWTTTKPALYIFWAECRSSDALFVLRWQGLPGLNPPTIADIPEEAWDLREVFGFADLAGARRHILDAIERYIDNVES
jgi:hypothetical protein